MGKRFVVIGAGNGGQSLAGDMVLRGVEVAAIYDKNSTPIEAIKQRGGIKMSGPVVQGFAPIKCATTDLEEAVKAGDVFLVAITSNFHKDLAVSLAPYLTAEHTIVLLPGYVGSSLLFAKALSKCGLVDLPLIGETISFPYATRLIEPAHAGIKARKFALPVAALPATRNEELLRIFQEVIPEAVLFEDSLSVGFNNVNPTSHVPYYLFNLGKVESPEAVNADFHSWGTPTVNRIKHDMDHERLAVMKAMGLQLLSYEEFQELAYGGKGFKPIPQAGGIPGNASQVPDRFIDEDVPMGLVAMASLGKMVNVSTPTIDTLIQTANLVRQKDFAKIGGSLEYLGIDDMNLEEILRFVRGK